MALTTEQEELRRAVVFVRWFKDMLYLYEDAFGRPVREGLADKSLYRFLDAAMKPLLDQALMPEFLRPGLTPSQYSHALLDALVEVTSEDG